MESMQCVFWADEEQVSLHLILLVVQATPYMEAQGSLQLHRSQRCTKGLMTTGELSQHEGPCPQRLHC
jgi:hypothetical protein